MKYKKKILKNGMRIVAVPMKDTKTVTVLVLVEAGSKYENKNKSGISHFLEHMSFKGTTRRPTPAIIHKELDSLGAESNAFTSQELTAYYAKAEYSHYAQILDVISDMYLNPVFSENEMQKEKGVILQEISMNEDLPQRDVGRLFNELLYGDQPAGWSVLGPADVIKNMKRDDFVNYRKLHYVARATTVVVAGKCDSSKVFKDVEKIFRNISTAQKTPKKPVKEAQKTPQILIKQKKTDQTHLILGLRAYDIFDKRLPVLKVLATVLGKGMSSRLFHKLRDEMGACYYVHAGTDGYTDHGTFEVAIGVNSKRINEVVEVIMKELKKFTVELVEASELKKTKNLMIGRQYLGLETSDSLAEFYGIQEILKHSMQTPEQIQKEVEGVTAKDIMKIAKEIFQNKNLNLAVVGDIKDEAGLKKVLKF